MMSVNSRLKATKIIGQRRALYRKKKPNWTNQGTTFLGGSFSNRDNVRAPS